MTINYALGRRRRTETGASTIVICADPAAAATSCEHCGAMVDESISSVPAFALAMIPVSTNQTIGQAAQSALLQPHM